MKTFLYFVHVLSPLHAGTGQGVGVIDLPIAREKATGFPYLPGSSVKGVMRDGINESELQTRVFGPDSMNGELHSGSLFLGDGRLLLLPVRSLAGTFAWVTCPLILQRLRREAHDAGQPASWSIPTLSTLEDCSVLPNSSLRAQSVDAAGQRVILEDLDLNAKTDDDLQPLAEWVGQNVFPDDLAGQTSLAKRLCVVHDDTFAFLSATSTEVTARIRLKADVKSVQDGALWYEESLPAESVLAGLALVQEIKASLSDVQGVLNKFSGKTVQLGGKATVGRGLCRLYFR